MGIGIGRGVCLCERELISESIPMPWCFKMGRERVGEARGGNVWSGGGQGGG